MLAEVATMYERWKVLSRELDEAKLLEEGTPEKLEYLRFQLRELRELALNSLACAHRMC